MHCMHMEWEAPVDGLYPEVILGADLLYDPEVVPTIVRLLQQLLTPHRGQGAADASGPGSMQPEAYFATQLRAETSMQRFLEAAARARLLVEDITTEVPSGRSAVVFHHLVTEEDPDSVLLHRIRAAEKT